MNKYTRFYSLLLVVVIIQLSTGVEKNSNVKPSLLLEVADVKETCRQLQKQGIILTKVPYHVQTGWAAELQDPSGNTIGITDYKK